MRPSPIRLFTHVSHMASSTAPSSSSSKLIFAPASSSSTHQADQYTLSTLSRTSLSPSPLTQFHTWFAAAQASHVHQPETVCLSTASLPSGAISSRFVYLKELDAHGGFVVYSNWGTSRKSSDVETNPQASLAFWWREVERQVRVEGTVERLSRERSQMYFGLRARGSKVGAWASRQSEVLKPREREGGMDGEGEGGARGEEEGDEADDGRGQLEEWVKEAEEKFEGVEDIPVPEFWGGLRVVPTMVEFWQGRESRLHDRFRYLKDEGSEGGWKIERLSP